MPSNDEKDREAFLRAGTIGDLEQLSSKIELADYDRRWPEMFRAEEERIRAALDERALRVEHCGSTSVPGLAAKPIIDIVLEVSDSSREDDYLPMLEAAGYLLRQREPDWNEHRMFRRPGVKVNLHVYSAACPEVARMLAFRNWLRVNDADRELYERAKRELVERKWKYVQDYADAKTDVVKQITDRALAAASAKRQDDSE
jgi:GrpB-like predicted nucleotidyltransferase (UPF0157 family)